MKMKKLAVMLLTVAAVASMSLMVACSGGSGDVSKASGSIIPAAPEANVNPEDIDPGWLPGDRTSDIWYVNGDKTAGGLYFTRGSGGMSTQWVDSEGHDTDQFTWLEPGTENNFVTTAEGKVDCDFVFNDVMTCYDKVSQTWYIRGDLKATEAKLADKTFVGDNGTSLTFNKDFSAKEVRATGDEYDETWMIATPNVVKIYLDAEYFNEYRFDPEAASVTELEDFWENVYKVTQ